MKNLIPLFVIAFAVVFINPNNLLAKSFNRDYCTKTKNSKNKEVKHKLISLPYALNALEPYMSAETVGLHHGKHLQAYVNNLNKLIEGTVYEKMTLEQIIIQSDGVIFNNAAQILNHNFFFTTLSPNAGGEPKGSLSKAINAKWGSFAKFQKELESFAMSMFGSGWAWLVKNQNGELEIINESNAGNPITKAMTPLLCIDVWEHAYYVDYKNRRLDFIKSLWPIINWKVVESRY